MFLENDRRVNMPAPDHVKDLDRQTDRTFETGAPSTGGRLSSRRAASFREAWTRKLDNGLKIIVREDARAPVVVTQLWYKVGASYEQEGQTGLSHALEHLVFKGSSKLPQGEGLAVLESLGVSANAITRPDATLYTQLQATNRLAVSLEILADQMVSAR